MQWRATLLRDKSIVGHQGLCASAIVTVMKLPVLPLLPLVFLLAQNEIPHSVSMNLLSSIYHRTLHSAHQRSRYPRGTVPPEGPSIWRLLWRGAVYLLFDLLDYPPLHGKETASSRMVVEKIFTLYMSRKPLATCGGSHACYHQNRLRPSGPVHIWNTK